MRKKMNRTSVIILIVAALTVAVPSVIAYSDDDHDRKGEQLITAIRSDNTDKALSLLKSGADPNYVSSLNGTRVAAIEIACEYKNVVVVRYLLSHGVKPWLVRQDKSALIRRTLEYPAHHPSLNVNEIMQILIDHGADVNMTYPKGPLPIIIAIRYGHEEAVKFLVDHGADVNLAMREQASPLWVATRFGNKLVVRLLLNAGADPSKTGNTFDQLIKLAQEYDGKEIVAILKDAMAKRKAAASSVPKK
ncbi:MAG: ankyrin repeat domain-containing protein [Chthonomonadales bacterium]